MQSFGSSLGVPKGLCHCCYQFYTLASKIASSQHSFLARKKCAQFETSVHGQSHTTKFRTTTFKLWMWIKIDTSSPILKFLEFWSQPLSNRVIGNFSFYAFGHKQNHKPKHIDEIQTRGSSSQSALLSKQVTNEGHDRSKEDSNSGIHTEIIIYANGKEKEIQEEHSIGRCHPNNSIWASEARDMNFLSYSWTDFRTQWITLGVADPNDTFHKL